MFFRSCFSGRVLDVGLVNYVGVSRDRIEIIQTVRAMGTTFGLFGSLFNVVLTGCRELPPCNSCLDVIPTELNEWRNPPKRKQTSYGRGISPCASLSRNDTPWSNHCTHNCRGLHCKPANRDILLCRFYTGKHYFLSAGDRC